jgi:hypothetical protein
MPIEDREKPVNVIIDKQGRAIDLFTGDVIPLPGCVPTLKANLRLKRKDIIKQGPKLKPAREAAIEHHGLNASAAFFDARIG